MVGNAGVAAGDTKDAMHRAARSLTKKESAKEGVEQLPVAICTAMAMYILSSTDPSYGDQPEPAVLWQYRGHVHHSQQAESIAGHNDC